LHRSNDFLTVYKQLVESSMDGILAFDREGRYTIWNTGMEKIFGIRKEERLGKHASELCPFFKLVDGTTEKNCYPAVLAGKGVIASDTPYVFPDSGRKISLEGHFSPLRDCVNNVIGGLAIIRDVTARKKSADELRRSEAYLAEAQALSHTGSYAHDVSRENIYLSEEAYRTFGFEPSIGALTYEQVRGRVHPEDVHIFEACSEEVIRGKKGRDRIFACSCQTALSNIFTALVVLHSILQAKLWKWSEPMSTLRNSIKRMPRYKGRLRRSND
jgi:PAS domain S-box-containing protein